MKNLNGIIWVWATSTDIMNANVKNYIIYNLDNEIRVDINTIIRDNIFDRLRLNLFFKIKYKH